MKAKMLMSYLGSLRMGSLYYASKAADLLTFFCKEEDDSVSCFALATLLIRGNEVNMTVVFNVTMMKHAGTRNYKLEPMRNIERSY